MDVSVITPIYKGNKYIPKIFDLISSNAQAAKELEIELILVNDSPEIPLVFDKSMIKNFSLKIVNNEKNMGIHRARINGIRSSSGEYVVMLDQDDEISYRTIISQYNIVKGKSIVISNGYNEEKDKRIVKLFKNKKQLSKVSILSYYFYIGNMIVSPGMSMIRKKDIPNEWLDNPLEYNGADDWLLWTMMLLKGIKFEINNDALYIHKYVGNNCSNDKRLMMVTSKEALDILRKVGLNSERYLKVYERRLNMRAKYEERKLLDKIICYLKNIDIGYFVFRFKLF